MKRIEIRGQLVGPEYDDQILHREIEDGIFCPSSKFLREMNEANGEDLEIFIDSEGGDVFSWNSAVNAISSYPGEVRIIVGSCAFSEAANLALTCGRPVYVHPNSVMLWHSAMSTIEDGAVGELRAEAEILERINRPVMDALKNHGVPADEVERGFEDRNALVLGADELVKYGIAQLIGTDALPTPRVDEALSIRVAALAKANQRIAAHFAKSNQRIDDVNKVKMDNTDKNILPEEEKKRLEDETVAADEPEKKHPCADEDDQPQETEDEDNTDNTDNTGDEQPTEETENTGDEQTEQTEETTEETTEEDTDDEMVKALEVLQNAVTELRRKTDDFEVRIKSLEDKLATKEVELEDAKKALKAERTRRIGAIAAAVSGKAENSGPADWPSAVKACKGDKLEAYKRYPELAKQWAK